MINRIPSLLTEAFSDFDFLKFAGFSLYILFLYLISRKNCPPAYIFSIVEDSYNNRKSVYGTDDQKKNWIQKLFDKFNFFSKQELALIEDVRQHKKELHQVTYFDMLTNLPNRTKLHDDFNRKTRRHSEEERTIEMSIFVLDIDRFRTINELYGRDAGDQVLIKVTQRLRNLVGEASIIARESEDEIFILIEDIDDRKTAETAKDIVDLFLKPFKINDYTFYVTASIGISRYPETAQDIDALLQQAEIAMYKVKRTGKNNYHVFMIDDAAAIERKRRIEFGLKEALIQNELYLLYQPKVKMITGEIYGVEALLRWEHPILGLVSPVEFIPIAEESGIINEIGYWVIHEAVRQTKEWHKENKFLSVAVNVSALQFEDPYFVKRIQNVLELYELDEHYLIVEITESVMQNVDYANKIIKELHDIGVSVAIDDFGTGYSSLSVLNNMFIDTVKIDKSFIDHVISKPNTASLVKTIIQMSKSMNFKTVAEGIESIEQSLFLKENNCEFGQGYYFSKPIKPEEVVKIMTDKKP
ncbi:diguanylate cyclase (GGDEF) domain-containing protein [Alkalibacterium subtropicum]|uniref:Diguanylate cyclase (GGDEF) domain-containing protein n=1 Tax=Alkalibacterium subtropicum TaxID=753702 RepID=A0A1I1IXV2_9LACT|nr:bifunctional diguanylate cyclase/phosphodiesterase [Alkalibacterium subtropicum]SFC41117.1 diguanylate cyclase (GGDEF) domain-containing protein [Alkalibacterium subtropicum]